MRWQLWVAFRPAHVSRKNIKFLLGIEGEAASMYFARFASLLKKPPDGDADGAEPLPEFQFRHRNRRPPRDPVNALLSFAYSMLTRTFTTTLSAIGFDVYRGFYHQPRYGRPALSLDLMEPYRSIIADSTVLQAVNGGKIRPDDFVSGGNGTALKPSGRKRFIAAFEQRLSQENRPSPFRIQIVDASAYRTARSAVRTPPVGGNQNVSPLFAKMNTACHCQNPQLPLIAVSRQVSAGTSVARAFPN